VPLHIHQFQLVNEKFGELNVFFLGRVHMHPQLAKTKGIGMLQVELYKIFTYLCKVFVITKLT